MTMIARAFLFPRGLRSSTTRNLASIGKHQELNASESYSSFLVYAHGIDTRYPQDPNESKYVEHVQKTIQKWETLHLCTFKTPIIDTFSLDFCGFYSLEYIFLSYYKHLPICSYNILSV